MDERDLAWAILSAAARLNRWATASADLEVSFAQARLLAHLEGGPLRIGDLARLDHSSQPSVTALVNQVQAAGLALKEADPSDARSVLVSLTERGQEQLRRLRDARAAVFIPVLEQLEEPDRDALASALPALGRLLKNL